MIDTSDRLSWDDPDPLPVWEEWCMELDEIAGDRETPDPEDLPEYWRRGFSPRETVDSWNGTARP